MCGLAVAIAISTLTAQAVVQVKTLGGGPNQASPARTGANDGDTLAFAKFNGPFGVATDTSGDLYVADRNNGKIRKISRPGTAGSLTSTFVSRLRAPVGVAVDGSNVVYVITQLDGRLRKYSSTGALLETVSGLINPTALALDGAGNVYVTELGGTVRVIAPDGSITLVTSGLNRPRGIAVLKNGLLAVSESGAHAIDIVDPSSGLTTLFAGGNGRGFADGPGATARFNQPFGLAVAPNGSIVVADRLNHRVRVVDTNGVVSTLYGVPRSQWRTPFAGWADGPGGIAGTAAARDPIGVFVGANGTVYVTEITWHLVRQATETGLGGTNSGNTTNIVIIGTNAVPVVGTNVISFGFATGEASSDFVGAAGQKFYAPVTLAPAPGQKVYSLQMGLSAIGETGVALDPLQSGFRSMVMKPILAVTTNAENHNGVLVLVLVTNVVGYAPIQPNYGFLNTSTNLLGVGWLERYEKTNLYNTLAQDLITYSIAKNTLFKSADGRVVLGAYRLPIPASAPNGSAFRIALHNPSGTADGVSQPVPLHVPTDGSLGGGAPNSIKRVTLDSRQYIVGDCTPFRWFNAGDFGDTTLGSTDVSDLFQSAVYGLNFAISDSDLFNAMDSSDGSSATVSFGDDVSINTITTGDGGLNVDDVWVTFRRSLDPTLKWFARYWSNGSLQVVEVPNTLTGGFAAPAAAPAKRLARGKSVSRPAATLSVGDSVAAANAVLRLPVHISLTGEYPLRVMMLNVSVEALDGSPAIVAPIQFQTAPGFQSPELSDSQSANNVAGAWLDNTVSGVSGDSVLAILTVQVPANADPGAAYRVYFNHFSGSPNGVALFQTRASNGLILLSDRSASTWGDGISDEWRLRFFGSIYASDSAPAADADADGVLNSDEFVNGTDPTDPTSS